MGVRNWGVRLAVCLFGAAMSTGALYAQPSSGDFEIGGAGSLVFQNSTPLTGSFFADVTAGKYFRDNMYIGAYILPSINFSSGSGGASFGSFGFGGEFEYGFKPGSKVWPFVGGGVGGGVSRASSFGTSSWSGSFQLVPEAGIKFFLDDKTSIETVVQIPINFASGGVNSSTQVLFGLRHIL